MEDVVIKQVLDNDGWLKYIELHQADNVIKLSMANTTMDTQAPLWKWTNLKKTIDGMKLAKPEEDRVVKIMKAWHTSLNKEEK